jgi:agmatine deiminase
MVEALLESEPVNINVGNGAYEAEARAALKGLPNDRLTFSFIPTNEPWCRDHGPIFLTRDEAPRLAVVDWDYNAWGGKYPPCDLDEVVPTRVAEKLKLPVYYPQMILEGGSIEVNGTGTLLTTESCLLNPNRNPSLSRAEIEQRLRDYLGVREILWLGEGIEGDDTDGHIDDIARFVSEDTVLCAFEDDPADENHEILKEDYDRLISFGLSVVKLPMPGHIGDRHARLPASYANFYIGNSAVVVPVFGHANDKRALEIIQKCFPSRRVVGVHAMAMVHGLGTIHCCSQQEPRV